MTLFRPLAAAALGLALASPAAADMKPVAPQGVLKCDFAKARRGTAQGEMLTPLVRGAFSPVPLETVQLVDKTLRRKLMVQSVAAQKTQTDTVEVVARLVNCTNKPMQVQARINFMNDQMSPTEPVSSWRRLFLEPKAMGVYAEKSMARESRHYLIEVRTAD